MPVLTYFPSRGLAELVRVLLSVAGVAYEQRFVGDRAPELLPALKASGVLAFGAVPLWEDGSLSLVQSDAILRHLARAHGLYGASEREHTLSDVLAETIVDARGRFAPVAYRPNYLKDEAINAHYVESELPESLDRLAKLMRHSTVPEAGYFVTAVPTWADFVAFDFLDMQLQIWPACLESYPAMLGFVERIQSLPTLRDYLADRRPSDFRP